MLTPFIHPRFLANDRVSIDQNKNFNTSSTVRAVLTVFVIVPKVFGTEMSRAGGLKLGVLVRWNASIRNSAPRLAEAARFSWFLRKFAVTMAQP